MPGLSENIRVRSIVGRFLEHSRIFYFQGGRSDPLEGDFYIGSADWMYRNLQTRVEAATPLEGRSQRSQLWEILTVCLDDRATAWQMQPDGTYVRVTPEPNAASDDPRSMGVHARLMDLALTRNRNAMTLNGNGHGHAGSGPLARP